MLQSLAEMAFGLWFGDTAATVGAAANVLDTEKKESNLKP